MSKLLLLFLDEIHEGSADGLSKVAAFRQIKANEYKGSEHTPRNYLQQSEPATQSHGEPGEEASAASGSTQHDDTDGFVPKRAEYVTRGELSALLYYDISDVARPTPEKLELCYVLYPDLKTVYESVKEAERILFHGSSSICVGRQKSTFGSSTFRTNPHQMVRISKSLLFNSPPSTQFEEEPFHGAPEQLEGGL